MESNKYNKSRTKQGETALGWWKIKKFVFNTSNHPVILSQEKCSYKVESLLSHQEHQTLLGLINSLQCNQRDALRIAIYELDKSGHKAATSLIRDANKSSKEKGHTARNKKIEIRLPKNEYLRLEDQVEIYELSPKETVRLALLWLAKTIKQTNQDLANSPRLSQEELAREWSKTYDRKGSKLNALTEASKKVWTEAEREGEARDKDLYTKRGEAMAEINEEGIGRVWDNLYGEIPSSVVNAHQHIKGEEWIETRVREEAENQEFNRREQALFRISLEYPSLTEEEQSAIWENDESERQESKAWEEKIDNFSDEELIDYDPELFFGLRTNKSSLAIRFQTEEDYKRREEESVEEYITRAFPGDESSSNPLQ